MALKCVLRTKITVIEIETEFYTPLNRLQSV